MCECTSILRSCSKPGGDVAVEPCVAGDWVGRSPAETIEKVTKRIRRAIEAPPWMRCMIYAARLSAWRGRQDGSGRAGVDCGAVDQAVDVDELRSVRHREQAGAVRVRG